MKAIPNRIGVLDSSRTRIGYLQRVSSDQLSEADCDRLIADNLELVAETLRNAGVLGEQSDLRLLGRQVRRLDLLCAERDTMTDELRRLVLIEDKLFRNPEARRQVVAQLLDYAADFELVDPQALIEGLAPEAQEWLEDQLPRLKQILATSDFLLLIAGDDVQPRAAQLVERMARDRDPLSHTDVAMLGLALFRDGDRILLVPSIVGGVVGSQREIRVHVQVSAEGLPMAIERVRMEDSAQGEAPDGARTTESDEFLASDAWIGHAEDAARLRQLLEAIERASIHGLRITTTESGRPGIRLEETRVGSLKILSAMNSRRGMWDSLVSLTARKVEADVTVEAAVKAFRGRLVQLGFMQHPSGRTEASIDVLVQRQQQVIEALRELADATRATEHTPGI